MSSGGKGVKVLLVAFLAFISLIVLSSLTSAQETTPVCFWSAQGPVCVERAVEVQAARPEPRELLSALLAGPTAEERARGLRSAIPEGTALSSVQVFSTTFTVRLVLPDEALSRLDGMTVEEIVQQIAATLEPLGWRDLRVEALDPTTPPGRAQRQDRLRQRGARLAVEWLRLAHAAPPLPQPTLRRPHHRGPQ